MKYVISSLVIGIVCFCSIASANYITDECKAELRSGPSYQYRITKYLPTGTNISIKDSTSNEHWVNVETTDAKGWVLKQHISPTKTSKMFLDESEKNLNRLTAELNSYKEELKVVKLANQNYVAERGSLKIELTTLKKKYQDLIHTAENAVQIQEQLNKIQHEHEKMKLEYGRISTENLSLKNSQLITGIQLGILAISFGVLLTIIIPRLSGHRRKSSW